MNIYRCKHFELSELLPPTIMNDQNLTLDQKWGLFDVRILFAADLLREVFGYCTINDGRKLLNCGYRNELNSPGVKYSQHKDGRALDLHFANASADKVREWIKRHEDDYIVVLAEKMEISCPFPYERSLKLSDFITCIEDGVSWVHIDCRNCDSLKIVKP